MIQVSNKFYRFPSASNAHRLSTQLKPNTPASFIDNSRTCFNSKDWDPLSKAIIDKIQTLLASKNLKDLFAYAASERHKVAKTLNHQPENNFGSFRTNGPCADGYSCKLFCGQQPTPRSLEIFERMKSQIVIDKSWTQTTEPSLVEYGYSGLKLDSSIMYEKINENGGVLTIIKDTTDTTVGIEYYWPENPKLNFKKLDTHLSQILDLDNMHFKKDIAEIAYHIASICPLKRGSAAVNKWLITALA